MKAPSPIRDESISIDRCPSSFNYIINEPLILARTRRSDGRTFVAPFMAEWIYCSGQPVRCWSRHITTCLEQQQHLVSCLYDRSIDSVAAAWDLSRLWLWRWMQVIFMASSIGNWSESLPSRTKGRTSEWVTEFFGAGAGAGALENGKFHRWILIKKIISFTSFNPSNFKGSPFSTVLNS